MDPVLIVILLIVLYAMYKMSQSSTSAALEAEAAEREAAATVVAKEAAKVVAKAAADTAAATASAAAASAEADMRAAAAEESMEKAAATAAVVAREEAAAAAADASAREAAEARVAAAALEAEAAEREAAAAVVAREEAKKEAAMAMSAALVRNVNNSDAALEAAKVVLRTAEAREADAKEAVALVAATTYKFHQGMSSNEGNLLYKPTWKNRTAHMKEWCSGEPVCIGFDSDGHMKKTLLPQDQWDRWAENTKENWYKGLYVKNSNDQAIAADNEVAVARNATISARDVVNTRTREYAVANDMVQNDLLLNMSSPFS
jgi:hypothetical protein